MGNNSAVKRNFSVICVTNEFTTLLTQFHQVWNDEHLWCSGSRVSLQTTDKGSIPVRCESYGIDRNFALIFVTKENTTLLFLFLHDGVEEHRWGSGSLVALEAIDVCSIPVRWRSYNIDGNFAVLFVTKESTTPMFSFSSGGIEEHHWCSGSTAHLQAIDMVLIPAWHRRPSLIKIFQEKLSSERFKSIEISTVQIWVDKHRWCSGSTVALHAIDMGAIPVRGRSYNIDGILQWYLLQKKIQPWFCPFPVSELRSIIDVVVA